MQNSTMFAQWTQADLTEWKQLSPEEQQKKVAEFEEKKKQALAMRKARRWQPTS